MSRWVHRSTGETVRLLMNRAIAQDGTVMVVYMAEKSEDIRLMPWADFHSGQFNKISNRSFKENPWKAAVIESLITSLAYQHDHDHDPRKAVQDLIDWEVKIALDPTISKEAQALVELGRKSVLG